jgi:hypothetical protein
MRVDGAGDTGMSLAGASRWGVKIAPAVDAGRLRGGGLDEVGPSMVSHDEEGDRIEAIGGGSASPVTCGSP